MRSSGSAPASAGTTRCRPRGTEHRIGRGSGFPPAPADALPASGRGTVLDTGALPALSRAERVEALDTRLTRLLADAAAGTPPPKQRRGAPPPRTGTEGLALVAVGSLGRREPPPHGDVDLVLVHDGRPEIAALADAVWYPIWDAGLRLDHSVRSVAEAVTVASSDVKAGLGLLEVRLVAGDAELAAGLRTA